MEVQLLDVDFEVRQTLGHSNVCAALVGDESGLISIEGWDAQAVRFRDKRVSVSTTRGL